VPPPILLTSVKTRLVMPSPTGYVVSQAISKYNGAVDCINVWNRVIDEYSWAEIDYINKIMVLFYLKTVNHEKVVIMSVLTNN
jgi:hypothetical protein